MDLEIAFVKPFQLPEQAASAGILKKAGTQVWIRGMDGHKQRRQTLLLDPGPIGLRQVRECEIGPIQKAEPVIIIFEYRLSRCPEAAGR